ncbi:MAG: EpsI family protein [Candidatus Thiodiazotropha sp.]
MSFKALSEYHRFAGAILFACLLILTFVYGQTAVGFYQVWVADNSLQSHGFLLLPLSYYLIAKEWYQRRHKLHIKFRPLLLLSLVFLSVIWLLTDIAQIRVGSQLMLIIILSVTVLALFGIKHTTRLVVPILLLISATTIWSVLSQPLQVPTAAFVNQMLHITGYASFQESYFITIPEGIFEVGDTCSGTRYQVAAITLAIIYAFFAHYTLRQVSIYLLLASAVAFISNSIRIYIVVLSGHYTNMTHSLLADHIWLGWVVFVICYAAFMYLTVSVERRLKIGQSPSVAEVDEGSVEKGAYSKSILIAAVLLISASVGPIYSAISKSGHGVKQASGFEFSFNQTELSEVAVDKRWNPRWLNADFEKRTAYRVAGINVDFYTAYYATETQGKEAVNDLNRAYAKGVWFRTDRVIREIDLSGGRKISIQEETIVDNKKNERIVWLWYYIGGELTSSRLQSKLYGILGAFKGQTDSSVIVLSSEKTADGSEARKRMTEFTDLMIDEIERNYAVRKH